MNILESGVGSESEHEGSGSKDDSDVENNIPSPPYVNQSIVTNSHNGQSSCNNIVRKINYSH